MIYVGFDLGDGESSLQYVTDFGKIPVPIPVDGKSSFITAVGTKSTGVTIGEAATQFSNDCRVCFKSHFLEGSENTNNAIKDFVRGVLDYIRNSQVAGVSESIDDPEKVCFVVGCPAGWKAADREKYSEILKSAGIKNLRLVSESRAAFLAFLMDKKYHVKRDQLTHCLVIDLGSSTLDFAYSKDGNEYGIDVLGNTKLGGGMMDVMLLEKSVALIEDDTKRKAVQETLQTDLSAKSKLLAYIRKFKEEYFLHEEEYLEGKMPPWGIQGVSNNGVYLRFNIQVTPSIVEDFVKNYPHPVLDGISFENRVNNALMQVKSKIDNPEIVILTGGASRMNFFREACKSIFKDSRILYSDKPETDISIGLAYLGFVDTNLLDYLVEVNKYIEGDGVEKHVKNKVNKLIDAISEPIRDLIYEEVVLPDFQKWRNGAYTTLRSMEFEMQKHISTYMKSPKLVKAMEARINIWLCEVMQDIQEDIDIIAGKYHIRINPIRFYSATVKGPDGAEAPHTDIDQVFIAILTTVVSIVSAMICGGAGIALIASGPVGLIIGAIIGIVTIFIGHEAAEDMIMDSRFPVFLRKIVPASVMDSDVKRKDLLDSIRNSFSHDSTLISDLTQQISKALDNGIKKTVATVENQI